jgi:hypothetical protein
MEDDFELGFFGRVGAFLGGGFKQRMPKKPTHPLPLYAIIDPRSEFEDDIAFIVEHILQRNGVEPHRYSRCEDFIQDMPSNYSESKYDGIFLYSTFPQGSIQGVDLALTLAQNRYLGDIISTDPDFDHRAIKYNSHPVYLGRLHTTIEKQRFHKPKEFGTYEEQIQNFLKGIGSTVARI